jgi:hypothetical protein
VGFAGPVAELPVQGQGLLLVVGGRPVPAQTRLDVAEAGQCVGFASAVAELPMQGQGLLEMLGGRPVPGYFDLGGAEVG